MAKAVRGKTLPITLGRRLVAELMHHARKVPSLPLSRKCSIPPLISLRRQADISWMAIFLKAYGIVSRETPEIRRCWLTFPWTRQYEHPHSECAVLIERDYKGERLVLAAKIREPESLSLTEIDERLRYFRETPLWDVSAFRQLLRLGHLPWPLRRFFLWRYLSTSGFKRCNRLGTFMVSSLGNFGVEQHHPLTPHTTYFTFGPISETGEVTLKVVYDHRVLDGRCVSRVLTRLEEILNTALVRELTHLSGQQGHFQGYSYGDSPPDLLPERSSVKR